MRLKKIRYFVIEVHILKFYFFEENGFKFSYDSECNCLKKYRSEHVWLTPGCYRKTYKKIVNSVSKLNKELGVKDYTKYFIEKNLNDAIKGTRCISDVRRLQRVVIVREID